VTTIAVFGIFRPLAELILHGLPHDRVIDIRDAREIEAAAEADVAVGASNPREVKLLLANAPKLRWYHSTSAGVDSILFPDFRERAIILTNNSGAYDVPVAEHVMMFLLAASGHLPLYHTAQLRREWRYYDRRELRGATLVIYGMGSIGTEVARLANGLGMRVIGVRRRGATTDTVTGVVAADRLPDIVREADYFVVAAPLTDATRGIISRQIISGMKSTTWIVNIARGAIIDEDALISALRERRIGGAALDVFVREPLPPDSPLWSLDNVIITPHAAGASKGVSERTVALLAENLERFRAGESLLNQVDLREGY
jgi:phosphoglycerate dehydrogenase-like enzyme